MYAIANSRHRARIGAFVIVLVTLLAGASCTKKGVAGPSAASTTTEAGAKRGGQIVLAAEEWPACLNPLTQCATTSWTHRVADQYVLPKALALDAEGNYVATPLVTEVPTGANGGLKEKPFTVTYRINPKAVWDDGTAITAADFAFTWQATLKTVGTLSTAGYDQIESIDTTSPKTVVLKFKEPYAAWQDLFGGSSGYVLKKASFPDGPELSQGLLGGIAFSGGPWKLQSWDAEQSVLIPNTAYWVPGDVPLLDQVTFVPRPNQDSEIASLLAGEVAAIYPQPSPGYANKLAVPDVKFTDGGGPRYENLWPNLSQPPLDDKQVRKALFMAVDREQIINTVIRPDTPRAELLNCAAWVPTIGPWCDNTQFADIKYDPDGAKKVLQAAGWSLDTDGIFAKEGKRLDLEFSVVAGDTRREQVQQLMIQQAKRAGITFHVKNYDRATLFDSVLPHLGHSVSVYVNTTSPDPDVSSFLACENIAKPPDFKGQNASAWCNPSATELMHQATREIDFDKRVDLVHKIGKAIHDDYAILPFYQFPVITAWRTDKVAGPIDEYTNSVYSAYWNINRWHQP
jgi:peptide/nickel transport system substrate-binding protein